VGGAWDNRPSGGWGYPSDRYYRRSPHRDKRPAPAVDYSKAPLPRKLETPPSRTVVVIGDSMADWLGYGLDENYAEQPEIGVERRIRATSGLVHYDAKNEALDWPQAAKDALSNAKPNAIVVMLGLNDRLSLRGVGASHLDGQGSFARTELNGQSFSEVWSSFKEVRDAKACARTHDNCGYPLLWRYC
jgi:hypothetical protein